MRDLRNIVNTRPIYARKLSNFAVVPHKRDVGLNKYEPKNIDGINVVPHKRDVGLNVGEERITYKQLGRSSQEGRGFEYS